MEGRLRQLGSNIRTLRKSRNWSQEELAHLANITPSHLGHIERGNSNPTVETLLGLSDALQVDVVEILSNIDLRTDAFAGEIRLDRLQGLYSQLPSDRQRELYGILKTMLDWNKCNDE